MIKNLQVPLVEADTIVGGSNSTAHLKKLSVPESGSGYVVNEMQPTYTIMHEAPKGDAVKPKKKKKVRADSEKRSGSSQPRFKKINSISTSISGNLKRPLNLVHRNNQLLQQYSASSYVIP